jgi:hypothetical protein
MFLNEMEQTVPWSKLIALIEPAYGTLAFAYLFPSHRAMAGLIVIALQISVF